MFNTKNIVGEGQDVPSTWVFQYYLDLPEQLTGQDIKIKSIFNPNERTPSFCIYVDKSIMQYKFKDFSTGKSGNKVDLIKLVFNLEYHGAMTRMVSDYNKYVRSSEYVQPKFKAQSKWKIDFIKERGWTTEDRKFWLSFRIGKTMLDEYNVKPIDYYNLIKEGSEEGNKLTIGSRWCYGYCNKNDEVYKM